MSDKDEPKYYLDKTIMDVYFEHREDFDNGIVPEGINDAHLIEAIDYLKEDEVREMENLLISIYEKLFVLTFQEDHRYEMFAWTIQDLSYNIQRVFDYPDKYKDIFEGYIHIDAHAEEFAEMIEDIYGFNQDNINKAYEIAKRNYGYYIGTEYMDDCGLDLDALRTFPELLIRMNFFNYFKRFIPDWR